MQMVQNTPRKSRLALDALAVESFEAGKVQLVAPPTLFTGRDSTCPCCSDPFTCPCSYPGCEA